MNPRALVLFPALVLLAGCGSSKLDNSVAEKLIKPDYPVVAPIKVPRHAGAEKGSSEYQRIETINGLLGKSAAFTIQRREEGNRVSYDYALAPGAPSSIRTTDKNFLLPAAEVTFARISRIEAKGDRYRVTYQIRLAKPTTHFGLFQFLHPQARLGDTKDRHALIEKQGGNWALMETDEEFKGKD